jgi:VWFA-related protein
MPSLRLSLLGSLLLLTVAPLAAETPETRQRFADSARVVAIEIPVEVTLQGAPLRGLKAEQFQLRVDGEQQELLGFEEVELGRQEGAPQPLGQDSPRLAEPPSAGRRRILLVFDLSSGSPSAVGRSQEAAAELLGQLAPSDLVGVGTFSRSRGFELLLHYTPDPGQVRLALAALGKGQIVEARDPLKIVANVDTAMSGNAILMPGVQAALNTEGTRELQNMADRSQGAKNAGDAIVQMQQLGALSEVCRSIGGRKHVVLFSAGFDEALLSGTQDNDRRDELSRTVNEQGQIWNVNSDEYFGNRQVTGALDKLIEVLRRGDCILHTVDTSGVRAGGSVGGNAPGGQGGGLFALAEGTGGTYFENFNQLGVAMAELLEQTSSSYLLSFQVAGIKSDGKFHKLRVEVDGLPRGARVSHRQGFFAEDAKKPPGQVQQVLALGSRLFDDRRPGELVIRAAAWSFGELLGGAHYVPMIVEVGAPAGLASPLPLDLFVYAFDDKGAARDVLAQRFVYDPAAGAAGLRALLPILLPPGRYSLRVLARESSGGSTGLAVVQLEVGKTAKAAMVPEEIGPWQLARASRQNAPADQPFSFGSSFFSPAIAPRIGAPGQLPLVLVGLDPESARVLDESRREVARIVFRDLLTRRGNDGQFRSKTDAALPALPPGRYLLELDGLLLPFEVVAGEPASRFAALGGAPGG